MKFFYFLALGLTIFANAASANTTADDGWGTFSQTCVLEAPKLWALQVEKGKSWTRASLANLNDLQIMSTKICPDYLAHPNDSVAIQAFVNKKQEILDRSPVIEKDGNELLGFLQKEFSEFRSTFAAVEIDFAQNPCGRQMQALIERTTARHREIRSRVGELTKTCFAANSQNAAEKQSAAKAAREKIQTKGPVVPIVGTDKRPTSDITGGKEDAEKRKQVPGK